MKAEEIVVGGVYERDGKWWKGGGVIEVVAVTDRTVLTVQTGAWSPAVWPIAEFASWAQRRIDTQEGK